MRSFSRFDSRFTLRRVTLLLLALLLLLEATSSEGMLSFTFPFGGGENLSFRLRRLDPPEDVSLVFLVIPFRFFVPVAAADAEEEPDDGALGFFFFFFLVVEVLVDFCFWDLPFAWLLVTGGVKRCTLTTENADRRGVVGSIGLNGLLLGLKHSVFNGSWPASGRTEGTRTIALDEKQLLGVVAMIGLKWFSSDRKLSPSSSSSSTA